jgi:hypothetical protein
VRDRVPSGVVTLPSAVVTRPVRVGPARRSKRVQLRHGAKPSWRSAELAAGLDLERPCGPGPPPGSLPPPRRVGSEPKNAPIRQSPARAAPPARPGARCRKRTQGQDARPHHTARYHRSGECTMALSEKTDMRRGMPSVRPRLRLCSFRAAVIGVLCGLS